MRARLLFVMIASGCAVNAVTACSSPDASLEAETAKRATQASSVTVAMFDGSGKALGSCSGTLVAKDLVLTAGHCAAGAAKWSIDARGADATSEATHAVTPWKAFGSDLSHPDHSDVALLILDKPISLDSYPAIATSKMSDGAKAVRFSRPSASATAPTTTEIAVSPMTKKGFRLNYAAKVEAGEYLDTGGAVIDPKTGKIHGVISGLGKESGLLHIARTDNFAKWIANAKSCGAATSIATRTYGTSSSSSSGWPGGGSSSGGWGAGGGDWGGYGGSGDKLDGGGSSSGSSGMGADGGAGSSGSTGSSSGSSGTSGGASGSGGSSGSSGGIDTSGSGSDCPGVPSCEGNDCPGVPGGGAGSSSGSSGTSGSSGSDGTAGSSSGSSGASSGSSGSSSGSSGTSGSSGASSGSSGASSGSSGTSGSSGSDGTNGGAGEVCPGPPNCPEPDSQACVGASCGGCGGVAGCVDATIDYGNCASCGASSGTGTPPVVR